MDLPGRRGARAQGGATDRPPDAAQPVTGRAPELARGQRLLLTLAQTLVRRSFPGRRITGLEHYTGAPGTLVVSNHRRDSDGPILGTTLIRRAGGRIVAPLPHFVAREDLFERGFLAYYPWRCPAGLRPLLGRLRLRWVLEQVNAHPMRRLYECSLAHALRDVLAHGGDLTVAEALRPRALGALAAELGFEPGPGLGGMRLSALLDAYARRLNGRWYGYRRLRLAVFRRIKPQLRAAIERQFDHFAALLDQGQTVILEPEGRISLSGRLRRPRAVLHALVNRPAIPIRVLPVAVTYDGLTTGPVRIFVDIQPELTGLAGLGRPLLDARVMAAVRRGCRVTGAQLAAAFLRPRAAGVTWAEEWMIEHIHAAAQRCRAAGLAIDPCLQDRPGCERRTRDIVAWGLGAGFLRRAGEGRLRLAAPAMSAPWLPPGSCTMLGYLHAELLETVGEARARSLDLLPPAVDARTG